MRGREVGACGSSACTVPVPSSNLHHVDYIECQLDPKMVDPSIPRSAQSIVVGRDGRPRTSSRHHRPSFSTFRSDSTVRWASRPLRLRRIPSRSNRLGRRPPYLSLAVPNPFEEAESAGHSQWYLFQFTDLVFYQSVWVSLLVPF